MSRTGYIYKIAIKDASLDDCYIGSTDCIRKRKWRHKYDCNNKNSKRHNLPVYQFIRETGGFENWNLYQLEKVKYETNYDLHSRERKWIEKLKPTLNCVVPNKYTNDKEHRESNKEKIEANKEKINCDCGSSFRRSDIRRHERTKKHIAFMDQQQ